MGLFQYITERGYRSKKKLVSGPLGFVMRKVIQSGNYSKYYKVTNIDVLCIVVLCIIKNYQVFIIRSA
jgi:hypothetical protein